MFSNQMSICGCYDLEKAFEIWLESQLLHQQVDVLIHLEPVQIVGVALQTKLFTIGPKNSDPLYTVTYNIKRAITSLTDGIYIYIF